MERKKRIFIFGDSFAANLFQEYKEKINRNEGADHPLKKYILDLRNEGIDDPLWFSDWLEMWGYEVYNHGIPGADNQTIIEKFSVLNDEDFIDGDRIIVRFSSFARYQWFWENGFRCTIMPGTSPYEKIENSDIINKLLWEQCINRERGLTKGYIRSNKIPFLNYFFSLHRKYKPIVTSFCSETSKAMKNEKWFFNPMNSESSDFSRLGRRIQLNIAGESNRVIEDGHDSRKTNYYYACIFDEIIKSGIVDNFMKNRDLLNSIKDRIERSQIEFDIPKKWKENETKKIFTNPL